MSVVVRAFFSCSCFPWYFRCSLSSAFCHAGLQSLLAAWTWLAEDLPALPERLGECVGVLEGDGHFPRASAVLAAEVAGLAGGAAELAARASALADAGELRLACHLVEWSVQVAPDDAALHATRAEIYSARRKAELSLMAKGIYGFAARESQAKTTR